jgi:positive regulator of sigma E activity
MMKNFGRGIGCYAVFFFTSAILAGALGKDEVKSLIWGLAGMFLAYILTEPDK